MRSRVILQQNWFGDKWASWLKLALGEFIGSFGDIGTLFPLALALIATNGIDVRTAMCLFGATYVLVGLYYRLPLPVQPLKAAAIIAIATQASVQEIRAAAILMAIILLIIGLTGAANRLQEIFPKFLIQGLQLGLGVIMLRTGIKFVMSYPQSLSSMVAGQGFPQLPAHFDFWTLPSTANFATALGVLVLPQIPLTIGNAVVATHDCALRYFGKGAERVTPTRLAVTIGLANLAAGLAGGIPVCHGAGGLTAHVKFGARTGAAGVIIGSILIFAGTIGGASAANAAAATPAWILGGLLIYVGIRHGLLARLAFGKFDTAAAVLSMAAFSYFNGNLLVALIIGLGVRTAVYEAQHRAKRFIAISTGTN